MTEDIKGHKGRDNSPQFFPGEKDHHVRNAILKEQLDQGCRRDRIWREGEMVVLNRGRESEPVLKAESVGEEREQPLGLSQPPLPCSPVLSVALEVVAVAELGGGQGGSDTPPSLGPSLRPLDLEFMKHLSKVVNIIPVIAKADTMTLEEKSEFKQRVRRPLLLFLSPPFPSPPLVQAMSYPGLLHSSLSHPAPPT